MLESLSEDDKFFGSFIIAEVFATSGLFHTADIVNDVNLNKKLLRALSIPYNHFDQCVEVLQKYDSQFK